MRESECAGVRDPEAEMLMEEIMAAASPEEAARIGRGAQRTRPHLVSPDWDTAKIFVMYAGLKAKVTFIYHSQNLSGRHKQ